jgi:hypothetical protein
MANEPVTDPVPKLQPKKIIKTADAKRERPPKK